MFGMKPDQKRVSALLVQTVSLLCKNGLHFEKGLRIQGLLGITIDDKDVFIVQIDDKLFQKNPSEEQPNSLKRKSKNDQENTNITDYKDLPKQFLDMGPVKATKCLEPPIIDEPVNDDLINEAKSPGDIESSKTDDEIIYVKSEVTDDLMENNEPSSLDLVHHAIESQQPFNEQISGIEGLDGDSNEYRNENNYNLVHVNQRRNFPQVNDFLMQQQFTNGSAMVTPPALYEGRCSNFKDQSASTFNETFHHLSGAQEMNEMIKESWTFTKYKQMTRHSNNNQMISSGGTNNALLYGKSQSSSGDKNNDMFGKSNELLPMSSPRRRSSIKTVVCQYPDCGKTFCHSCHLYRHQRLKHGRRFGVVAQTSFSCQFPECGKIFYRKASLINHNFAVHNLGPRPPSPTTGEEDDVNISF